MLNIDNVYAKLDPRLYHKQPPTPLINPKAGHFNTKIADQLGWLDDPELVKNWVNILGGEIVPNGFEPLAMAYAGHQFGQWAGQLGDGRGLLLTQVIDKDGQLTDLHLKGAGLTPYSRMGDGRAVIRSVVREYLAGHALNSLGICSSNALGFVVSDTPVRRESMERGAALLRTADSHVRFGHFEWVANFAPDLLRYFTHQVIKTYFPACLDSQTPIKDFLSQVVQKTAKTVADWQLIGFAHGVMNTDNLSITGATIDFGPYGFMERFNPQWINNHSDYQGRYVFENQPSVALWNLSRLISLFLRLNGEKLTHNHTPETLDRATLTQVLDSFGEIFYTYYRQGICTKFGLANNEENFEFAMQYLQMVQDYRLDYTNSLRALVAIAAESNNLTHPINRDDCAYEKGLLKDLVASLTQSCQADTLTAFEAWQQTYIGLIEPDAVAQIQAHNPVYILRNAMAQRAIEKAEQDDMSEVERLYTLLSQPYQVSSIALACDTQPPASDALEICVSCSS